MFSALNKVVNYFYTQESDEDEDEEEGEKIISTNENQKSDGENKTKTVCGKVTHIFSNHGLIEEEIYFSFDCVLGGVRLHVGDEVSVVAKQEHVGGAWSADQVHVITAWDAEKDQETNLDTNEQDDIESNSSIPSIGFVSMCEEGRGVINDNIAFIFDKCSNDFHPFKGDWVNFDLIKSNLNSQLEANAENVHPLRTMKCEGCVTACMPDHGYVDGQIYFVTDACRNGYTPRKWDKVKVTAIESIQGKCSWRAVSVIPLVQNSTLSIPKFYFSPTQTSFLEDLLKDKGGISISTTDFGEVIMGAKQTMTIWIRNKGVEPQVFLKSHISSESSNFTLGEMKLVREQSAKIKNDIITGTATLYPTMCMYMTVSLDARLPGVNKQMFVLTFEHFKIGRYLTALVKDAYYELVDSRSTFTGDRRKGMGYARHRETTDRQDTPWVLPGEKPNSFSKKLHLPNKLPMFHVPSEIRNCVLHKSNLLEVAPELEQSLTIANYSWRFQLLLYLEEIQMEIDIREFDMERVCLMPFAEYLALKVPGLAEGRPSVLIGDKVYLSDPGDEEAPIYEGYVHEVLSEKVLLKLSKDFHESYVGKDYNVMFTFNRSPIRRCHQAAEFGVRLGENVLFPSILIPKLPQLLHRPTEKDTISLMSPPKEVKYNTFQCYNSQLNVRQRAGVMRILQGQGRPLPYILFGPPGTGKTVTIVEAILQIFTKIPSSRIIACTPSNSAADLLAERLHTSGLVNRSDMVRLNAFQRSEETVPECIKPYCTVGDNLDIVVRYRILVCTCVTAGILYGLGIKSGHFTHVFVDEAGQATEPECLIAACLAAWDDGQIVLAGDPMQLGPVLRSNLSKKYGLELSFLERLIQLPLYNRNEAVFADHGCYDPLLVTKLVDNYRSHESILTLSSKLFYDNELEVKADKDLTHQFTEWSQLPKQGFPVIFHGIRGEDLQEGNSPSWFNPVETVQVIRYIQALLTDPSMSLHPQDIGLITPYRKQVEKIRLLIDKLGMDMVKVGSVEEFQGQERQIIIISTVRSNERLICFDQRHTLGFLSNPKRFNVAISRARALLIVVGNPYVLLHDKYWQSLIDYCVENGGYTGCQLPGSDMTSAPQSDR